MNVYQYPIKKNDAVNRWWISDRIQIPYKSKSMVFDGDINYTEEYVTRDYPVRTQFMEELPINNITEKIFSMLAMDRLYMPFGNNRVEASVFLHKAKHIFMIGETYIVTEEAGEYDFEVSTSGGMKLWLNNSIILDFRPYTKNIPSFKKVTFWLEKGLNKLNVYTEDLAERDTYLFLGMKYLGEETLHGALEIEGTSEDIRTIEAFLDSCYTEKDMYNDGLIQLNCTQEILDNAVDLVISMKNRSSSLVCEKEGFAGPRTKSITVADVKDLLAGIYKIELSIMIGTLTISKNYLICVYPQDKNYFKNIGTSINLRKRLAVEHIATYGEDTAFKALAIMNCEKYLSSKAEKLLVRGTNKILNREDNSVTRVPVMLMAIVKYKELLNQALINKMEVAVTNFRYWIDEPGNDVMWYFSESHSLQFHTAQYLAGIYFPDNIFSASGRKGIEQRTLGRERLNQWFTHFFDYGYGDWSAINHMPMNLSAFLQLYELADDSDIREKAVQCMDFTFRQMTYHSHKGLLSSTFGRTYEWQLKGRELTEAAFLEWITNGQGRLNRHGKATTLYALSSYEPDDVTFEVAPEDGEGVIIEMNQGQKEMVLYTFRTKDYLMSSTQNFKPFIRGHQQHLMNVALGEDSLPFFINHPGELNVSGQGRPSYWAGNDTTPMIRQYRNAMLLRFEIREGAEAEFIHAYVPSGRAHEVRIVDQSLYLNCGTAYLVARFSHPIQMKSDGATAHKDIVCSGKSHQVYVKCSTAKCWDSFEVFVSTMGDTRTEYTLERTFKVKDVEHGVLSMDADGRLRVEGVPVPLHMDKEIMIERTRLMTR